MSKSLRPVRTRLAPEVRRELILDHAAALIREQGVSALNMDKLGREAGVSKPLVYNYFPNRIELLKALLLREVERNRQNNLELAGSHKSMDAMVRATSRAMLEYVREKGIIIQQLMLEPDVAEVLRDIDAQHHQMYVDYLSKRLVREYGIPRQIAEPAIDIGLGLSSAAGAYFDQHPDDIDFVEDLLVTMIMGSLQAVSKACSSGKLRKRSARKSAPV
ncbi:TetR/AcrR family transcriptional regulator [Hyphomonas sp.]|jgi:AcrR family transcriptional regulator|uniref:TetR/AcrR family transcriptional regulator n=1 Tax=Hyphomonas sp. TaxID=87 RepID=UPI0025C68A6C|nr:TetR/AcrR family transcriptional regulator [Hyphomonas sp.]